jgi:hypothetical protein
VWGANPGPLDFIYFLIFHHFTAEPQRLPLGRGRNSKLKFVPWENFWTLAELYDEKLALSGRPCRCRLGNVISISGKCGILSLTACFNHSYKNERLSFKKRHYSTRLYSHRIKATRWTRNLCSWLFA